MRSLQLWKQIIISFLQDTKLPGHLFLCSTIKQVLHDAEFALERSKLEAFALCLNSRLLLFLAGFCRVRNGNVRCCELVLHCNKTILLKEIRPGFYGLAGNAKLLCRGGH